MRLARLLILLGCLILGAGIAGSPVDASARAKRATKERPARPGCTPKWSRKNQRIRDVDRDGVANIIDADIDGDGRRNRVDGNLDGDKRANDRDSEMDADGIPNSFDRDIDADGVPNVADRDMDADGIKNANDRDMDGDGILNKEDPDVDADCLANKVDGDIDGDGVRNFEDIDSDSSGDSVAATPETTPQRVPRSFFGVVSDEAFFGTDASPDRRAVLDELDATGSGTIRQNFAWAMIEPAPGVYDFRLYDDWMEQVTRRGYAVLAILFNPPAFRSSAPAAPERGTYPPRSNGEFGAFAAAVARRYGPGGAFWAQHPDIAAKPIRSWQIWNEPNTRAYWPTGPDPEGYVAMLRTVGASIKSVDSGAEIVGAGLPESPGNMPIGEYVSRMYKAGAKGAFDTLAVHPYASSPDRALAIVGALRKLMDANGDTRRGIWVSEIGWADGGPASQFTVGERGQSEMIRRVFATLASQADRWKIHGVIYFNWRDAPPYGDRPDFWGLHTGLYNIDGTPKPALSAYATTVKTLVAS